MSEAFAEIKNFRATAFSSIVTPKACRTTSYQAVRLRLAAGQRDRRLDIARVRHTMSSKHRGQPRRAAPRKRAACMTRADIHPDARRSSVVLLSFSGPLHYELLFLMRHACVLASRDTDSDGESNIPCQIKHARDISVASVFGERGSADGHNIS